MAGLNLPSQFNNIPRHALSYPWPSPIHALPKLTQLVSQGSPDSLRFTLWAKREDQAGPWAGYGNKYRKFEYIIPDILTQKKKSGHAATILVTEGGIQSNHTVQVASMAKILGMKCLVLLHRGIGGLRKAEDKNTFLRVGNIQLNKLLGADIRFTDERETGDDKGPLLPVLDELKAQGEFPYWISSGASLHPLGGLGYARCAFEIEVQEKELMQSQQLSGSGRFDYIFVACGSGLIAGFKLLDKTRGNAVEQPRKIIGILVSRKSRSSQEERILRLARLAGKLIGLDPESDITPEDVHLDDRFVGNAYGLLDDETAATIQLAATKESLILDPVYTGKVMCGTLHWARELAGSGQKTSTDSNTKAPNTLFVHTGGQSALCAYADVWPASA